jgi:hypothetical protein
MDSHQLICLGLGLYFGLGICLCGALHFWDGPPGHWSNNLMLIFAWPLVFLMVGTRKK